MTSRELRPATDNMQPIYPNEASQEGKLLKALLDAKGEWVNKQYFVRTLYFTQAGKVIWMLENKFHWQIEHSKFHDQYGFKSYRIVTDGQPKLL